MIKPISNQELFHMLNQKKRLIEKEMNASLNNHELFASQWSILFCIQRFGSISQTEISNYLNVEAPTVTRTLIKLEKKGWIIRKPGQDKRERIIELTKEAEKNLPVVKQTVDEVESQLVRKLSEEEKKQLYYLLHKIN